MASTHIAYDNFLRSPAFVSMPLAARLQVIDASEASLRGFPHVARFHLEEAAKLVHAESMRAWGAQVAS